MDDDAYHSYHERGFAVVPWIVDMIAVGQVVAAIERIERNISRLSPK